MSDNGGKLTMFEMIVPEQAKVPAAKSLWGELSSLSLPGLLHRFRTTDFSGCYA
jgi:hypothetical protein